MSDFDLLRKAMEGICELCGAKDELRPYGHQKENICFDCSMKNPGATEKAFRERTAGVVLLCMGT